MTMMMTVHCSDGGVGKLGKKTDNCLADHEDDDNLDDIACFDQNAL